MRAVRELPRSTGFSLIELMVSLVLGAILMAGAISLYLASKRSYEEVEQVAALAENASYAEQVLNDAVRHIGFMGEVAADKVDRFPGTPTVADDCDAPAEAYNTDRFIHGVRVPGGSSTALNCITGVMENTDVLVIKYVRPLPYTDGPRWNDPNNPTPRDGTIETPSGLADQTTYVMTNNSMGYLFEAPVAVPNSITDVPNGVAWEYRFEAYYIRDAAIPKLARMTLSDDGSGMTLESEDVADGVENMRLMFGYDTTGDGEVDTYGNVDEVGSNWGTVLSLEVFMLVRSATQDAQYVDQKVYTLGDLDVTPTELNFRRLVTRASVSMRNPKLVIRGDNAWNTP